MKTNESQNDHGKPEKDVCVIAVTTQGDWEKTFEKTSKVSEVIAAIIKHFGFAGNGKYELRLQPGSTETMKPERTLVSYGLSEKCEKVFFTDLGNAA